MKNEQTGKTCNVAVVGATGLVGEALLELLAEREFPVASLYALAGEDSVGDTVLFRGKPVLVEPVSGFDFAKVDFAFMAASAEVAEQYGRLAAAAGAKVIDTSGYFSADPDVPVVVAAVNGQALEGRVPDGGIVVASAAPATIAAASILKPLQDEAGLKEVHLVTMQSASAAGRAGVNELAGQTARLLNGQPAKASVFNRQIAFNLIPAVGAVGDSGYSTEELRTMAELIRVLAAPSLLVIPTCIQVPVFYGQSISLEICTDQPLPVARAQALLKKVAHLEVKKAAGFPTPVEDGSESQALVIGRLRQHPGRDTLLNLWAVSDNLRNGAALNCIQIAEILLKSYF